MIDLTGRTDVRVAEEVVHELKVHCQAVDLSFVIVGAAARDLAIHALQRSEPVRATEDIDIAVAVHAEAQYTALAQRLERRRGSEHTFIVLGVEVDIIPFGGLERNREIRFADDHVLDVNGMREACETSIPVTMPMGTTVNVASAPAQTALKILAWRDRHHDNRKDALDLQVILRALSEDPFVDEVWDDENALEATDSDIHAATAYHYAQKAAEPFFPADGAAVVKVLHDPHVRPLLESHMKTLLATSYLRAYEQGFIAGLGR